jgi:protein-disulfide isomerase
MEFPMIRPNFIVTLTGICLLSASVFAAPSPPTASTPPTSTSNNDYVTRVELPGLIKEALMKDPTILSQVVEKMQAAQEEELTARAKEEISKRKSDLFSDPASPVVGSANADVTIVEFFDYHCGYCKQALANLSKLLDNDKKVRLILKEYPILSEDSRMASKAALAVNHIAKDKYFDFHKAMFAVGSGTINESIIAAEAKKLGIDPVKLKKEMESPSIQAELDKNRELGAAIGAMGTPAIIIGENFYPGAMPYELMQKAVKNWRAGDKSPLRPDSR